MADQDDSKKQDTSEFEIFDLEGAMNKDLDQMGLSEEERFKLMLASGGGGSKIGSGSSVASMPTSSGSSSSGTAGSST